MKLQMISNTDQNQPGMFKQTYYVISLQVIALATNCVISSFTAMVHVSDYNPLHTYGIYGTSWIQEILLLSKHAGSDCKRLSPVLNNVYFHYYQENFY